MSRRLPALAALLHYYPDDKPNVEPELGQLPVRLLSRRPRAAP